jgi:hypothetical protein
MKKHFAMFQIPKRSWDFPVLLHSQERTSSMRSFPLLVGMGSSRPINWDRFGLILLVLCIHMARSGLSVIHTLINGKIWVRPIREKYCISIAVTVLHSKDFDNCIHTDTEYIFSKHTQRKRAKTEHKQERHF